MTTPKKPNPCKSTCPKCGSGDIVRKFHAKGTHWRKGFDDEDRKSKWVDGTDYDWKARKDCIVHHCRCCQWDWDTDPLKP